MNFGSQNRGRRIVISGTYGTGKTTTTDAISRLTGIPKAVARGMREILPETFPGKRLEDCGPSELVQLGLTRFAERATQEAQLYNTGFVSDGSAVHEWAYGRGRQLEGANGPGSRIFGEGFDFAMDAFGEVVRRHSRDTYTDVVHLPVEFPLKQDGHRPVSEAFRAKADEIISSTWGELGLNCYVVGGDVDERVSQIVELLGLEISPTAHGPIDRGNGKLWYAQADDALGDARGRFFSHGFRNTRHDLYDIEIDPAGGVVSAKVDLSYTGDWSRKRGEVCRPHLSSIDAILITGQLAQMLMYAQDGIGRDESNNLWLRELELSPGRKPVEDITGLPAVVRSVKSCKPRLGGKYWHAATIEGEIGESGFTLKAKVGYQLPDRLQGQ